MTTRIVCVLVLAGCGGKVDPMGSEPPPSDRTPVAGQSTPWSPDGHAELAPLRIASRGARRMSIPQLEKSLDRIAGLPLGTVSFPPDLAVTLGKPDYLRVTEESLEPSALFMKFMLDLGGFYCQGVAQLDLSLPAGQRVLERYTDVDENIRYLLFRFTGLGGADADPYVPQLRRAYDLGAAGALGAAGGAQAVCMSLVASPELLIY